MYIVEKVESLGFCMSIAICENQTIPPLLKPMTKTVTVSRNPGIF